MASNPFYVVIPARYASTRLPGKLLLDIGGKPIIQHVYERASQSAAKQVVIATDDERIASVARSFGAYVCMTAVKHRCGTERIAEVVEKLHWADDEIIVNVQGDEPFIYPEVINQVAQNLVIYKDAAIATLCEPLQEISDLFDPNVVKVVYDHNGYALYFSRAPIPWDREHFSNICKNIKEENKQIGMDIYHRHLGIYAYHGGFIKEYVKLQTCALERIESLEQLRALWYGYRIHVASSCIIGMIGIDTMEDLLNARRNFS